VVLGLGGVVDNNKKKNTRISNFICHRQGRKQQYTLISKSLHNRLPKQTKILKEALHIIAPWCSFVCTHNLVAELTLLYKGRRGGGGGRRRRSPLPHPSLPTWEVPTSHLGPLLTSSQVLISLSLSLALPLFLVLSIMHILGDGHVVEFLTFDYNAHLGWWTCCWVFLLSTIMHILGWWACWWSCFVVGLAYTRQGYCV
jgi:hypothetical protein